MKVNGPHVHAVNEKIKVQAATLRFATEGLMSFLLISTSHTLGYVAISYKFC